LKEATAVVSLGRDEEGAVTREPGGFAHGFVKRTSGAKAPGMTRDGDGTAEAVPLPGRGDLVAKPKAERRPSAERNPIHDDFVVVNGGPGCGHRYFNLRLRMAQARFAIPIRRLLPDLP
jgi:hypothetical protein